VKLTKEEREANRRAFAHMSGAERLEYVLTYYKLPLVLALTALVVLGSLVHEHLTRREPVLWVGMVNVSVGSELEQALTADYLAARSQGSVRESVELYQGLYLTDDPNSEFYQYVYASRMKLMAALESKQLDVFVMNQEAWDALSQSGYLMDLTAAAEGDFAPYLEKNLVIYEDNAQEAALDESVEYKAVTGEEQNALECSRWPLFSRAGFTEPVYLGVSANSPRLEQALDYLHYLCKS
jgi:hypothetical protein